MESFFSRYRNALVLISVLLAQVIGLAVQVRRPGHSPEDKGGVLLIRAWVTGIVTPPERLLHNTGHGARSVWMNYIDLIHVRKQNQNLQTQLDRLRLEEASLAEDARQGQRLQALLGFREKYVYKTVLAQVIGTSGTEQSEVLLIDKGSRDGIRPDMPVITPDGIVGKTRDVFGHSSQVLEVSDPTSGAGVILQNTRIRGVLRGNSWGQPEIVNVSPDERIKPGEPVLTSGGDAIFPRGLAVGTVDRVVPDPDGTLVNVLIKPAANLAKLEEVMIITSSGSQMPASMQQDLSDAQQKASEILAERLPSRVDPNAPPSEQDDAQQTVGADGEVTRPMKPPQALHPDHYTPSDTPPAVDLRPGQRIAPAQAGTARDAGNSKLAAHPSVPASAAVPDAKKPTVQTTPDAQSADHRRPESVPSAAPAENASGEKTKKPAEPGSDRGDRSKPGSQSNTGAAPAGNQPPAANQPPAGNPPPAASEPPAAPPQNPPPQGAA